MYVWCSGHGKLSSLIYLPTLWSYISESPSRFSSDLQLLQSLPPANLNTSNPDIRSSFSAHEISVNFLCFLSPSLSLSLSSSKILIIAKGTSLQIPKTWAWTSKSSTSPTKPRHSKSPAPTYCWIPFTIQTTNQGTHGLLLQSARHWYIDIPPPQQKPRPPLPLPKITQIPLEWSLT